MPWDSLFRRTSQTRAAMSRAMARPTPPTLDLTCSATPRRSPRKTPIRVHIASRATPKMVMVAPRKPFARRRRGTMHGRRRPTQTRRAEAGPEIIWARRTFRWSSGGGPDQLYALLLRIGAHDLAPHRFQ